MPWGMWGRHVSQNVEPSIQRSQESSRGRWDLSHLTQIPQGTTLAVGDYQAAWNIRAHDESQYPLSGQWTRPIRTTERKVLRKQFSFGRKPYRWRTTPVATPLEMTLLYVSVTGCCGKRSCEETYPSVELQWSGTSSEGDDRRSRCRLALRVLAVFVDVWPLLTRLALQFWLNIGVCPVLLNCRSTVISDSGVWGKAPAVIDFGVFWQGKISFDSNSTTLFTVTPVDPTLSTCTRHAIVSDRVVYVSEWADS